MKYELTVSFSNGETHKIKCSAYDFDECGLHLIVSDRDENGFPVKPVTRKHFPQHAVLEVTARDIEE